MNWFKKKIIAWVREDWEISLQPLTMHDDAVSVCSDLSSESIQFNIYNASGGIVIETRRYDQKTDRRINSLHVINDGEDFSESLAKIITFEKLKM
jgi:hypothetical protein